MPRSDGTRIPLQERWVVTVSDKIEEVIPYLPAELKNTQHGVEDTNSWLDVSFDDKNEESYVMVYEQLRRLKQYGIDASSSITQAIFGPITNNQAILHLIPPL